ncbi:MAG: DUF4157 domain-containing protein [Chloroflexota bacterium]
MTQRQPQDFTHGGPVDSHIEAQINQSRGGGQPMEDSIRQPMEQAFGADFSDVRIHTDAQAHNLNEAIQARAFTTGNDIYFKEGEYSPSNTAGQELLAHEITHVIQQGKTKNENIANRETSTNDISNQKFIQEITKHLEGMPNPKDSKDNFDRVTSILNFFLTSLNVPGRAAVNVPIIIKKISDGEYFSAAKSLISLAGSASVALSKVMIAMRVGMSSSMGALSTSAMTGPMLGMLGELAGPIAMTLAVGYGIYDIPNNVNSEIGKWFYVADLSGLLTSWIFAVPSISPHQHLIDKAKDDYHSDLFYYEEFGVLFNRSALQTKLESLRKARLDSERAWKKEIKSTPGLQRAIRKIHEDNPVHFWLEFAEQLENRNPSKQQYSLIFTKDIIKKLA